LSETMVHKIKCYQALFDAHGATEMAFFDAFLTQRPQLLLSAQEQILRQKRLLEKVAIECRSLKQLVQCMKEAADAGKHFYFWCASMKKLNTIVEELCAHPVCWGKVFLVYSSETSDKEKKQDMHDVDEAWSKVDFLCTSPASTIGVSFDVRDHFDLLFMYRSSHSGCMCDVMQGIMHVRHFKQPIMYFTLSTWCPNDRLLTDDRCSIEAIIQGKIRVRHTITKWYNITAPGKWMPAAARENEVLNLLEEANSALHYHAWTCPGMHGCS